MHLRGGGAMRGRMASNARVYSTPSGLALGPLSAIADGGAKGFTLSLAEGWFEGLVVRKGDAVFGYVDRCPHIGAKLASRAGDYQVIRGEYIACPWHGALFEVAGGKCVGGPAGGQRLEAWPVAVMDGVVMTA